MLLQPFYTCDGGLLDRTLHALLLLHNRSEPCSDLRLERLEVAARLRAVAENMAMLNIEWKSSVRFIASNKNNSLAGSDGKAKFEPDVWIRHRDVGDAHLGRLDLLFNAFDWNENCRIAIDSIRLEAFGLSNGGHRIVVQAIERERV